MRELSGLRAIAIALVGRFKEGAQQLEADAIVGRSVNGPTGQRPEEALRQTELVWLTKDGIQNLLDVLFRIQSITLTHQCVQWFTEREIYFDADQYHEFYYQARSARASLRQSFEGGYDVVMSSISNSDIAFPSLLIELVMQSANLSQQMPLPPNNALDLFKLLQAPTVQDEMVRAYAEDVGTEPVEVLFRVPAALLLYFALDMAYVSLAESRKHSHHGWSGSDLVAEFIDIADSFAAQMDVPDDMKATLLALWLIENAVNVRLTSNDEVGPIYHGAVTRILESSAIHLQRKAGLEADLILYMIETLVHRGESSVGWKIWTAFDMVLSELPAVATEYVVMVNLELTAWERALSLLRNQNRLDLFELVLKWLVKSNRMKELVHYTTLSKDEERIFDDFMMGGRVLSEAVLHEGSIRKADLLVMYYVLRNDFDKAWAVHHEHLALIRESTSGNTNVALAVLHQQSFRIRTGLLENMKPEPVSTAHTQGYKFKRSFKPTQPMDTDLLMIGSASGFPILQHPEPSASEDDEQMSDDVPFLSSAPASEIPIIAPPTQTMDSGASSATGQAAPQMPPSYSPGIYSSRSSQPRANSITKSPLRESVKDASTPVVSTTQPTVPIGSIDWSPFPASKRPVKAPPADGGSKRVVQALNFGPPPAPTTGGDASLPIVSQPLRAAFNSSSSTFQPAPPSAATDDLSLKPRPSPAVDTAPVDAPATTSIASSSSEQRIPSSIAATASAAAQDVAVFETPKRFSFVREPQSDSRVMTRQHEPPRSPATQELEAMELEPIDEEFSTPTAGVRRKEAQSTPSRRNPRRASRTGY